MLISLATVLLLLGGPGLTGGRESFVDLDFGRPLDDWFIFDLDGDGRKDVLALFDEGEGRCAWSLALQLESGAFASPISGRFEGVVMMALGRFGGDGRRSIALVSPDRIRFLGLDDDRRPRTIEKSLPFSGFVRASLTGVPGFWHWEQDLDGDGRDDLALPSSEGVRIYFGKGDHEFGEPIALELPIERAVIPASDDAFEFMTTCPRPVFGDIDGDGRKDLCWFDQKGLTFRRQTASRRFDPARQFDLDWLATDARGGVVEQTDVDLRDVDGDGKDDLILAKMRSEKGKIAAMETFVVVLRSRGGDEPFGRKADQILKIAGVIGVGPKYSDLDGDGRVDLLYGSYGAGLGDAVSRFLGRVSVKLQWHRAGGSGAPFHAAPDGHADMQVSTEDFERWGARGSLIADEDLDGDGVADLVEIAQKGKSHKVTVTRGRKDDEALVVFDGKSLARFEIEGLENSTVRRLRPEDPARLILILRNGFRILLP